MGNLQDVGSVSDALFAYQCFEYTGRPDRDAKARTDWVHERTHNIITDKSYMSDLAQLVTENHSDSDEMLFGLLWATSADHMNQLAAFHAAMTREARRIAESEATIRFGF